MHFIILKFAFITIYIVNINWSNNKSYCINILKNLVCKQIASKQVSKLIITYSVLNSGSVLTSEERCIKVNHNEAFIGCQ